jgi:hypothetical protein
MSDPDSDVPDELRFIHSTYRNSVISFQDDQESSASTSSCNNPPAAKQLPAHILSALLPRRCLYLSSMFLLLTMSRTNMVSTKAIMPRTRTVRSLLISLVNSRSLMNPVLQTVGALLSSSRMHSEHQPKSIFVMTLEGMYVLPKCHHPFQNSL